MTHDDVTPLPISEPDDDALAHDAIGAYILGALPDAEADAFEAHLRVCAQCQAELRDLGPIAELLPRLYDDLDLPGVDPLPLDLEPSTDLKTRIVAEATAIDTTDTAVPIEGVEIDDPSGIVSDPPTIEAVDRSVAEAMPAIDLEPAPGVATVEAAAETVSDDDVAAVVSDTGPRRKPRGRIAPGETSPDATVIAMPRERRSILPWALAAAMTVLATGAILWALAMMGQIDDLKAERDAQDQQIALLTEQREQYLAQTPALVFPLVSTTVDTGDSQASAMVYMDPDPEGWGGIVAFRGMTVPPAGQVYQLWTITDGQVTPGPTFVPDAEGRAMVQVGGEASGAGSMAITMEPDGGSQTPTTSPIMQGSLTA